jgi:hypothetical protein
MSVSIPIKSLCEEISNSNNTPEIYLKLLSKLYSYLKNSDKYQKDIFLNLTDRGLNQLLTLMRNKNENLRKLSFIVLILILYNNEVLQNIFCEKYNFNPIGNVICLNWLPSIFKEKVNLDENLINELKKNANLGNTNSNTKYWKFPNNKKYTDEIIPDPERYLLGFFYTNKNGVFSSKDNNNEDSNIDINEMIKRLEEGYKESNLELYIENKDKEKVVSKENKEKESVNKKEEFKKTKNSKNSKSIDSKKK